MPSLCQQRCLIQLKLNAHQHRWEIPGDDSSDNSEWLPHHQIEMVRRVERGSAMNNFNQPREEIHDVSPLLDIFCHLTHRFTHAYRVKLQSSQLQIPQPKNAYTADLLEILSVFMDQVRKLSHHPRPQICWRRGPSGLSVLSCPNCLVDISLTCNRHISDMSACGWILDLMSVSPGNPFPLMCNERITDKSCPAPGWHTRH